MYLIIFTFIGNPVDYCGPFLTEGRANEYATTWRRAFSQTIDNHKVVPLVVPHNEWAMGLAMANASNRKIGE